MTTLSELHHDHINLNRLLEMLDHKVERLRAGSRPDFSLMADVVSYVGRYADQHHHPREDVMYEHFRGRDSELDKGFDQCEAEHAKLKQLSHDLAESIDAILHDAVMPMDTFTDQLQTFVTTERQHLDFEEQELFPGICKLAVEQDWKQLESEVPQPADPLFGEKQAAEYRDLYRALMEDLNRNVNAG
jgi:hemerythrin-like domain-containing protein